VAERRDRAPACSRTETRVKRIPKTIYQTVDEIEARIRQGEAAALQLVPETEAHRAAMKELAQLRMYAEAKRWLAAPGPRAGA
jgi:hypothetical protein